MYEEACEGGVPPARRPVQRSHPLVVRGCCERRRGHAAKLTPPRDAACPISTG